MNREMEALLNFLVADAHWNERHGLETDATCRGGDFKNVVAAIEKLEAENKKLRSHQAANCEADAALGALTRAAWAKGKWCATTRKLGEAKIFTVYVNSKGFYFEAQTEEEALRMALEFIGPEEKP